MFQHEKTCPEHRRHNSLFYLLIRSSFLTYLNVSWGNIKPTGNQDSIMYAYVHQLHIVAISTIPGYDFCIPDGAFHAITFHWATWNPSTSSNKRTNKKIIFMPCLELALNFRISINTRRFLNNEWLIFACKSAPYHLIHFIPYNININWFTAWCWRL